ncbi:MAG: btuB 16 [Firmicutes bacterium]|nr:btuB 16 [Bacillota bacterium]
MNRKKIVTAALLSCLVVGASPVLAEEQATATNSTEIETVIVSAKKEPPKETIDEASTSYLVVPESSKATTQTFTKADIEAMHPKDITEIIERGLGMSQYRWGNRGFFGARSRGGDSLGIVIDGVYLPQTESSRIMYNFPVEMIESVTIVRDSSAVTLGPLATIGVKDTMVGCGSQGFVMIKTRKSTSKENEAKISYGSFDTEKLSIFTGDKINDNAYFDLAYAKSRTDGQATWNNWSNFDSYVLKAGYKGKDYVSDVSVFYNQGSRGGFFGLLDDDGTLGSSKYINYPYMSTLLTTWNTVKAWDPNHLTGVNLGYSKVSSDNTSPQSEDEYLNEFNLYHIIKTDTNTFRLGGQAIQWRTPTGIGGSATSGRREDLFGYYVYDQKRVSDRLTVDGGFRIDNKHVIQGATTTYGTSNPFWDSPAISASVGSTYKLNSIYSLSSQIGYTNQPTDSSLTIVTTKTSLPAEERKKYEAGIDANFSKALHAALTAFYYDIKNGKYVSSSTGKGTSLINYYDAHDMVRQGAELSFDGQLSELWGYKLGYSYFASSYASDNNQNPHHTYTLGFNYHQGVYDANINLRHVSRFYPSATDTSHLLGNYTTADLNFGKTLNKTTKLTIFVRNIANCKYPLGYVSGYFYDVGRSYGVELTKKF